MKKIFPILMLAVILVSAFVIAEVNERNEVFLGRIIDDEVHYTNQEINNVNVLGVVCRNADCSRINGYLWDGDILNTGGNNRITLVYPTELQSQHGYGVYFFREGYIPSELRVDWAGTGTTPDVGAYDDYLFRKDSCLANIDGVNVDPGVFTEGEIVSIDVTVDAPLVASGSIDYVPVELRDYYQTDVEITIEIVDNYDASNIIHTETRTTGITFGEDATLNFEWETVAGDYRVVVTTDVPDTQCMSSIVDTSVNNFHVNSAGNNAPTLNIPDQTINEGDTLALDLDDFANDVDGDSLIYALVSGEGNVVGDAYTYTASQDANTDDEVYTIVISANDGNGGLDTDSFTLTVIDDDTTGNNAPVLDNIGDQNVDEGDTLTFDVTATDVDGDTLIYSVASGEGSMTGNTYTYTAPQDADLDDESFDVTIRVEDGNGGFDEETFTINVNDDDTILDIIAPIINLISPDDGEELDDSDIEFEYEVSDDGSGLDYCELFIDGDSELTHTYLGDASATRTFEIDLDDGDYEWRIECYDLAGNVVASETRDVEVEDDNSGSEGSSGGSTFLDATSDAVGWLEGYGEVASLKAESGGFKFKLWLPLLLLFAILLILLLIFLIMRANGRDN